MPVVGSSEENYGGFVKKGIYLNGHMTRWFRNHKKKGNRTKELSELNTIIRPGMHRKRASGGSGPHGACHRYAVPV
jgi:hypothetical protein